MARRGGWRERVVGVDRERGLLMARNGPQMTRTRNINRERRIQEVEDVKRATTTIEVKRGAWLMQGPTCCETGMRYRPPCRGKPWNV
jgi:hypothetical protein